ncbi:MAG: N-6 DNA methylase [Lachnospiraceae bacterium]|nr:N-6 DNA methylase [Lachnospiraceae bacterium]
MKAICSTIQKEIEQLCTSMKDSILFSLLLLRQLSQDGSLSRLLTNNDAKQIEYPLWESVLTNQEGNYMSSIAKSLTFIEPVFPFVHKLIAQNERQDVEERVLKQLIHLLSDISIDDLPCAAIYENHLQRKTSTDDMSSSSGDFYTPKSIAQCLAAFLNPGRGTAYDPCCGSGALLLAVQKCSKQNLNLYGQTQDENSYLLSQMTLILHGESVNLGKTAASTLLDDQHKNKKFDYIIANPPFNHANWFGDNPPFYDDRWHFGIPPRSNANFAWLQHILSHLQPNGRAAVILPNGTLTTQTYGEAGIRQAIIQNKRIEAVITLPPGLFYSTKVPCCIWLLANSDNKSGDILFINAAHMKPEIKKDFTSEHIEVLTELVSKHRQRKLHTCTEWYGVASLEKIEQNDFILSPNRYTAVLRPGESEIHREYGKLLETIEELSALPISEPLLSSIARWKNAKIAKHWEKATLFEIYDVFGGVTKSKDSFGKGVPILDVKTVIHSPYIPDSWPSYVDVTEDEKRKYGIEYGDVFLNRTSETTRELACCCVALEDQDAVYGGFIKRLRPYDKQIINPLYAACYFRSEIYRWEIENVSTVYTTYASIDNRKLSKITVFFPDMETQKNLGDTLFEVFQYQKQCSDTLQKKRLKEFEYFLIRQYITYPILRFQRKEGDSPCR